MNLAIPMDLATNKSIVDKSMNSRNMDESSDATAVVFIEGLIVSFIILCALIGNILVIFSVYRHRKLRSTTNYFIVSLAFADALVALLAMTFSASIVITGKWVFNQTVCSFWFSCDVFFCTASIFNLCCISVDRFFAVFRPLDYQVIMTGKVVALMIACGWFLSICISFLPIFLDWHTTDYHLEIRNSNPEYCVLGLNKSYAIISTCVSFWIPAFIIILSYSLIYREASKQERLLRKHRIVPSQIRISDGGNSEESEIPFHNADSETVESADAKTMKIVNKMKHEYRLVRTLGIVVGAFVLCWLPFSLLHISMALCETCYCPPIVLDIFVWLGYFNSVLNPIIYGYLNRQFREAFKEILQTFVCCCTKIPCLTDDNRDGMDFNPSNRSTENLNLEEAKNSNN